MPRSLFLARHAPHEAQPAKLATVAALPCASPCGSRASQGSSRCRRRRSTTTSGTSAWPPKVAAASSGPTARCRCCARSASASPRSGRWQGMRMRACLHVTTETANLVLHARRPAAPTSSLCASNPLSTQDDVAAALVEDYGIPIFAIKGEDNDTYYRHIHAVAGPPAADRRWTTAPTWSTCCTRSAASCSPTSSAAPRRRPPASSALRAMEQDGVLHFPIIAVNDADTKHLFDNRYGTGQSHARRHHPRHQHAARRQDRASWPATAGAAGASPSAPRGMGAQRDRDRDRPAPGAGGGDGRLRGDADGPRPRALGRHLHHRHRQHATCSASEHFEAMKDGAIVANSGHFNVEIDIPALRGDERRGPPDACARSSRSSSSRDGRSALSCWARAG